MIKCMSGIFESCLLAQAAGSEEAAPAVGPGFGRDYADHSHVCAFLFYFDSTSDEKAKAA